MKVSRSIFFKLFAVYGLTFFVITAGLGFVLFGPPSPRVDFFEENLRHYVDSLAQEIGNPPNLSVAEALHRDLGLEIGVISPEGRWSTTPEILSKMTQDPGGRAPSPGALMGGTGVIQVRSGAVVYGFSPSRINRQKSWVSVVGSLGFLAGALALSWWVVSLLLRPLREMGRVFGSFGDRGWADRVSVRGRDELADLGTSLNAMADRVEGYVGSMHRLLAGVSHELRSPLTRMKVALEFIDHEGVRASLNEEIDYFDRMTGLLLERERLLTRPGALVRTAVTLGPWVQALTEPYRAAGMDVVLEGPELTVWWDADRMAMALRNLCENVGRHAPGSPVFLTWTRAPRGTVLVVEDRGPGIPPAILGQLGEPFFLADRSRSGNRQQGGFGLGLSLVVSIVEAHGGKVGFETASPQGLRVRMEFPDLETT